MNIPEVDNLIGRLNEVLAKEAELIWRVPRKVKDIKAELENMQAFLIDVDQGEMQAQSSEGVEMEWVADIRDKAYEAEGIIDKFTYHMDKRHHHDISCLSPFHLLVDASTTLWVMHQTAHKLQKIKKKITDIVERHTRADEVGATRRMHTRYLEQQQVVRNLRDGASFIEEETFIGFHKETKLLRQLLLPDFKPLRVVISLFGMSGAGKTTLAANIFKTQKGGFDLSAWVTISQTYSTIKLLRSLIRKLYEVEKKKTPTDLDNKESVELVETLRGCLSGKRYLIVLDDVWDTIFWEQMKDALPEDEVGSRILITTRDERKAPSPFDVESYKLHIGWLEESESWDLFSMKAFANHPNKTCPRELYSLAQMLVDKCKGLPLALTTLGGHMCSKKEKKEWTDVHNRLCKNSVNVVKSTLMLSFSGLPYSLKHCFLYCCLYPKDSPIKRKRLIRQWIAEGFVGGLDGVTPEEEAESYLSELVFQGMLLIETRNVSGRPKVIKMHGVMRDFALEIAKKEKFCDVCDGRETINEFKAYRWSIHCSNVTELKLPSSDLTQVRSLSLLGNQTSFSREHLLKFKMLRLLDLESNINTKELADEVGNLFNLRYLRFNGQFPSSIGGLLNLQTLDISCTSIIVLPEGVSKLRKLRHLTMKTMGFRNGIPIEFDISKLNKLQVLIGVRIDKSETLRQLGTLTKLTRLDISVHRDIGDLEERQKNWEALGQLKLLQRFKLKSDVWGDPHIENLAILPQLAALEKWITLPLNLKKVHLGLSVRFQSRWFDSLHNIQHMSLRGCTVSRDQLCQIAALINLVSLELSDWSSDDHEEVLHFCGGFAKLKQLSLIGLSKLEKVIFEKQLSLIGLSKLEKVIFVKGLMPHMESLSIRDCAYLQELPEGIEHLTNLQKLEFEVPERLKEGIKNWKSKVQHIPTIDIK